MVEYAQDGTPIRYDAWDDNAFGSTFGSKAIGYKPKKKYSVVAGGNKRFSSREEAGKEVDRLNMEAEAEFKSRGANTWYVGYQHPISSGPAGRANITPGSWYAQPGYGTMSEQSAKAEAARLNELEKTKIQASASSVMKLPSSEQQSENLAKVIEQTQQTGTLAPSYNPSASVGPITTPKSKLPLILGGVALVATVAALWVRFRNKH